MNGFFVKLFKQKRSDVRKQREAIWGVLSRKSSTISEMGDELSMPKNVILWNLLAMLRWGQVEIVEETDEELVYALSKI